MPEGKPVFLLLSFRDEKGEHVRLALFEENLWLGEAAYIHTASTKAVF